jgi:flagellar hook-associated protein 2
VNNVAVTSASNTLTDVIPGATLTLGGEDATQTVRVTVARDGAAIKDKVGGFVEAYNKLVDFVTTQRAAALEGKPNVATNPMVRALHTQLRATVLGEHGAGSITRLAGAGVGFDRAGHMTIDEEAFDDLVASDPQVVQDLFAGSTGTDGAFDALESLVETYTQSDGLVPQSRTRLIEQVDAVSRRIDTLEAQLLLRRDSLQREFIAADQAMQRLQAQVGSLSALGGQYRLF